MYQADGDQYRGATHSDEDREEDRFKQYDSDKGLGSDFGAEGDTDVVSFLYQAGKRYQQRLDLLRQQKIATEMSQVTGKPNISPFAEEYFNNKAKLHQRLGKNEETVQDRLHRLHERKLEREKQKLSTYKAHQEKEEMAEVTLKPKITDQAKALSHRGSQAEITEKWLEERKKKYARLQELKLRNEVAEVQPVPMISPYSAEIVHAGVTSFFGPTGGSQQNSAGLVTDQSRREVARSVSEYLLAREKQRQMRLKALTEARNRLEGSTFQPQISKRAQSMQMGPIERLYTKKKTAAEYAAMSSGEESEGDEQHDSDEGLSEYEEQYDEHGNVSVVKVRGRGEPRKAKGGAAKRRDGRSHFDKVFNPECTFKPYVSEASRLMVEERDKRLGAEKSLHEHIDKAEEISPARNGDTSPRGTLKRNVNALDDPAYKKAYPEHTFKPTISQTSRKLALKRQEKYMDQKEKEEANEQERKQQQQQQEESSRAEGLDSNAQSPSSRLHEHTIRNSYASSVRSSSGMGKARMDQSTEQSVNRHLRMLGGGGTGGHDDSVNDDGSVNDSQLAGTKGGSKGASRHQPLYASGKSNSNNPAVLNASQATDEGHTGKPALCPKSIQMAEQRAKRVQKELQRQPSTLSATHGSSNISNSSSVEPLSAHELMYQVGVRKRELKEQKTAQELRAREEAEAALCTFTPQRSFRRKSNASTNPSSRPQHIDSEADEGEDLGIEEYHQPGQQQNSASQRYFTAPKSYRELRQQREEAEAQAELELLERRRLVMTSEQSDAFARKNAQWLKRREQSLALLKRSETDKDYEECTFQPQVHDQVPLPIGASANAPGVDNFLQRQREARVRKDEEQKRRDGLGTTVGDKRPIGGYTKPEPFLLGKAREEQRLLKAARQRRQGINESHVSMNYGSENDYSRFYDPRNLGGGQRSPAAPANSTGTPKHLTRREWAEIRDNMLAPEQAPAPTPRPSGLHASKADNTIHHYYQSVHQKQQQQRKADTSTTNSGLPNGGEFTQFPSAVGNNNLLHQHYFSGAGGTSAQVPSIGGGGGSGAAMGLFDKSPVDFVLNNHENILRQLQMRQH